MLNKNDVAMLRKLAARVAEIAALPVQEEKRALWRKLNARKPVRPMVIIDQVCWNEMNASDELTLRCTDWECRCYEEQFRRTLYQWTHFPADMVVDPFIRVGKAVHNCGFGIEVQEETAIPNVRKVSMSPWVNEDRGASEIGGDFVYSRKPSPAFLATDHFSTDNVRADLIATRNVCDKHGCPLEYILKDISTVRYEPERLSEWARIAMEVAGG